MSADWNSSENIIGITVEGEVWDERQASYITLSRDDLANLSGVMLDLLREAGVRSADRILIYDYNTTLSTMLMSRAFTPGLPEGVCEKMRCTAMCTDGLSELATRSVFVFGRWKPHILLIRSDLVAPFRSSLKTDGLKKSNESLRSVIVLHNDVRPWPGNLRLGSGNFDRFLLYKVDPSLFMCIVKPCGGLYYPRYAYNLSYAKGAESSEEKSVKQKLAIHPNFRKAKEYIITSSLECESPEDLCFCGEKHEFRTEELAL